jgi:uncharacterized protein (AIM24 family)/tetratricopeptide (TPR) repeat protein
MKMASKQSNSDFNEHMKNGRAFMQENNLIQAKEEFEKALKSKPGDDKTQNLLAMVFFKLEQYHRAIKIFSEIVKKNPNVASLYTNLGIAYLKENAFEESIEHLKKAIELEDGHHNAHNYLGLAYSKVDKYELALAEFKISSNKKMISKMEEKLREISDAAGESIPHAVEAEASKEEIFEEVGSEAEVEAESDSPASTEAEMAPEPEQVPQEETSQETAQQEAAPATEAEPEQQVEPPPQEEPAQEPEIEVETAPAEHEPEPEQAAQEEVAQEAAPPETDQQEAEPPPEPQQEQAAPAEEETPAPEPEVPESTPVDEPAAESEPAKIAAPPPEPEPQSLNSYLKKLLIKTNKGSHFTVSQDKIFYISASEQPVYSKIYGVLAYEGKLSFQPEKKKFKGKETKAIFGSKEAPIMKVTGSGQVIMNPGEEKISILRLDEEMLYVVESRVFAFQEGLIWENGRIQTGASSEDLNLVQFKGTGEVAVSFTGALSAFTVSQNLPAVVDYSAIVGWAGKLLPQVKSSEEKLPFKTKNLLEFKGEGVIIVEAGNGPAKGK